MRGNFTSRKGEKNPAFKHGLKKKYPVEYNAWVGMKTRCYHPKYRAYHRYGGRGIKVCDRWLDPRKGFINFFNDMGLKPNPKYSLDRIDGDGDYSPENCEWASQKIQTNHTSSNHRLTLNGETRNITEWAKIYGIHYRTIGSRLQMGWNIEEAITSAPGSRYGRSRQVRRYAG